MTVFEIRKKITSAIFEAVKGYDVSVDQIVLEHPEVESFGDYSCNIAMRLSKSLKKNPMEIAENIATNIRIHEDTNTGIVEKIDVIKPGFINFWVKKDVLLETIKNPYEFPKTGKKVMVEFTDPNPFKEFHIGHLYSNTVGEVLARLNENMGHEVKRACYQGDVGMHVAKSLFGLINKMKEENILLQDLEKKSLQEKQKIMGDSYVLGSRLYDEDENAKVEMNSLNKKIYDKDPSIFDLYQKGREWSLEYFETIYSRLGMEKRENGKCFNLYYFESVVGETGQKIVEENLIKGIFEKSEGAIIFPGSNYGLHNRVFINSLGLPTYEAKELGLAVKKYQDFPYDLSIPVTGNEINEYFKVLMKALSLIKPELEKKTFHIGHGMVKLPSGKMSSRSGDIITGVWLLDEVKQKVKTDFKCDEETAEKVGLSAIKYALLKSGLGKDVIFDLEKSIAVEGNSGPYLQYSLVRIKSILAKIKAMTGEKIISYKTDLANENIILSEEEMRLVRTLYKFPEVIQSAAENYAPNMLCNFLFELSQKFNNFYATNRVIENFEDKVTNGFRWRLLKQVGEALEKGMQILNLPIVEKM
jgi:arginyl-tRNA synthetase